MQKCKVLHVRWIEALHCCRNPGVRVTVLVPCGDENGFCLTADALRAATTDKTRWVLFNSPSNSAGGSLSRPGLSPVIGCIAGTSRYLGDG
ncbi:aminotransferase class I/II-fold pyridoxal phosphate-dependent enzyme [Ruegeria arenilitoris]|uniref:aminotransferase class I/II-fold pyridoxal phosphate-dependent enzyme n=1 Tax=Ruegeria arenilitoris TaxID=1173585 RepID=UPI003C798AC8